MRRAPLYRTLAEIATIWIAADAGYWIILPLFGISISYNDSPVAIAGYYAFWLLASIIVFQDSVLSRVSSRFWSHSALSLGLSAALLAAVQVISLLPTPSGEPLAPYTDILFASPWYFLPKSFEILLQQTLIAALVFALAQQIRLTKHISLAYAILFGGAHVIMLLIGGAPAAYLFTMTMGAVASAALFPYLILHVRNGFAYTYLIHFGFYLLLALSLHLWPPNPYAAGAGGISMMTLSVPEAAVV